MSLTRPTPSDLFTFWGGEAPEATSENVARATFLLDAVANLAEIETGVTTDPTNPRWLQLFKLGILDFTVYQWINRDSISENYNSFTGERIGSYSYTKKSSVKSLSGETGIEFWDMLIRMCTTGDLAPSLVSSTYVFSPVFEQLNNDEQMLHDPSSFLPDERFNDVSAPVYGG